jgi:molybdopterin-synthase adenylyltransferase
MAQTAAESNILRRPLSTSGLTRNLVCLADQSVIAIAGLLASRKACIDAAVFGKEDPACRTQGPAMFSPEEIERYARHIVLHGIGGPGQQKLKTARVLVVGAGGLGCPLMQYLAAAGIGEIVIVDDDQVSLSNLQRQVLHGTGDIGRTKVESARDAIARLNPHVRVVPIARRLTEDNAPAMVRGFDVVADGSDNFATRYAVSDACFYERLPLVTAAAGAFDGTLTVLRPYERGPLGEPNPTYRCLYAEPPPEGTVPACAEAGVLGALTGMLGAMMALEVIREIVGFGEGLVGRLLLVDAINMRFETVSYRWDPENPLNGRAALSSGRSDQIVLGETLPFT